MIDYTLTDKQSKVFKDLERALLACKDENVLIWLYNISLAAVNGDIVEEVLSDATYHVHPDDTERLQSDLVTTFPNILTGDNYELDAHIKSISDGNLYVKLKDAY